MGPATRGGGQSKKVKITKKTFATTLLTETTTARRDSGSASAVCGGVVVVVIGGGVAVVVVSGCGGVMYCKSATGPGGTKGISFNQTKLICTLRDDVILKSAIDKVVLVSTQGKYRSINYEYIWASQGYAGSPPGLQPQIKLSNKPILKNRRSGLLLLLCFFDSHAHGFNVQTKPSRCLPATICVWISHG